MAEKILRSTVDRYIEEGMMLLDKLGKLHLLPPQAYWNLDDFVARTDDLDEMKRKGIGWDVTDFGSGRYREVGLLLYTLSNGMMVPGTEDGSFDQDYANKLLIVGEGQVTPMHHHGTKKEDIWNIGGGVLEIGLYAVDQTTGSIDTQAQIKILRNNMWRIYNPATVISLEPGERVRLDTNHYHKFWGRKDKGPVVVMEVSMVNDDKSDNYFLTEDKVGRFPEIEEDKKPRHLLYSEYPPDTVKFLELERLWLK